MRSIAIVISLAVTTVLLGALCILFLPLLEHTGTWPLIQRVLTPIPYIIGLAVGLLFMWAGFFGDPSTLRRFTGLAMLLPPSIGIPLARAGFVIGGLIILAIVGINILIHSLS
jgi:hypothetical protein